MTINAAHSPLQAPRRLVADALRQARRDRSLTWLLLRLRLAQQYRHSSLGLLWALVPTLVITAGVTMGQHLAGDAAPAVAASGQVPLPVHAAFGVVLLQIFIEAFNGQRTVFEQHLSLLQRMKFPVEAVVLAQAAESSFHFLAKLPVLLLVLLAFGVPLEPRLLLGALACLPLLLAGIALGALMAPLSALGRDLDKAMAFLPWLLFLASPVFYRTPVTGPWATAQQFNPFAILLDVARHASYGGGEPHWPAFWLVLALLVLLAALGALVCKLAPPHLAERLSA